MFRGEKTKERTVDLGKISQQREHSTRGITQPLFHCLHHAATSCVHMGLGNFSRQALKGLN